MSVSASKSEFAGKRFQASPKPVSSDNRQDWRHAVNEKPETFESAKMETMFTTTLELEKKINRAFKVIFSDYYGCKVNVNSGVGDRLLKVYLYFMPRSKDSYTAEELKTRAFVQIKENTYNKGNGSLMDAVCSAMQSNRFNNRQFGATDYAAEILYDFLLPRVKNGNNRVNPFIPESYMNIVNEAPDERNGRRLILCCIDCVDIFEILKFIYGKKDDGEHEVQYDIALQHMKRSDPTICPDDIEWVITILRMNKLQSDNIMKLLDIRPMTGSLRVNTTL